MGGKSIDREQLGIKNMHVHIIAVISGHNSSQLFTTKREPGLSEEVKATLTYIAGYIVRKDDDTDDSHFYYDKYGRFTDELNRGGLRIPGDSVCQWVFFSYSLFYSVASSVCRTSLCNLLMKHTVLTWREDMG